MKSVAKVCQRNYERRQTEEMGRFAEKRKIYRCKKLFQRIGYLNYRPARHLTPDILVNKHLIPQHV